MDLSLKYESSDTLIPQARGIGSRVFSPEGKVLPTLRYGLKGTDTGPSINNYKAALRSLYPGISSTIVPIVTTKATGKGIGKTRKNLTRKTRKI